MSLEDFAVTTLKERISYIDSQIRQKNSQIRVWEEYKAEAEATVSELVKYRSEVLRAIDILKGDI